MTALNQSLSPEDKAAWDVYRKGELPKLKQKLAELSNPTAQPAESVEDAKAFKRVAIELRIRFPVEIQYNSEFEAMVKRLEGGSL